MTSGGGLSTWNVEKIWTYSTVRGEAGRGMYIYIHTRPRSTGRNRTESGCRLGNREPALCVLQNPTLEPNLPVTKVYL